MKGKVIAVNISGKKGVPKETIEQGEFKVDHGLLGDAHAGNWHRQVSSCIMPTEGIFTKVLKGGIVKAGDEIEVIL